MLLVCFMLFFRFFNYGFNILNIYWKLINFIFNSNFNHVFIYLPNYLCTEEGNRRLAEEDVGTNIHIFGRPGDTALSSPSQPATQKKQTMVQCTSQEEPRPFPKTAARKSTNNRTRAKTLILTDISVKNQLERGMEAIQATKMKKTSKVPPKRPPAKKALHPKWQWWRFGWLCGFQWQYLQKRT